MITALTIFNTLSTAEEYLDFFSIPYDPKVVSINRLHILRKFSECVNDINQDETLSEEDKLNYYRMALQNAYTLFLESSPLKEKLFKVFQEKPGNVVMVSEIT